MAPIESLLWRRLRIHQIYGANTDVGKTIFSTFLCNAASNHRGAERVAYLKPVSTGAEDEADTKSLEGIINQSSFSHIKRFAPSASTDVLYQYDIPCSPHTAALASGRIYPIEYLRTQPIPSDHALLRKIQNVAAEQAKLGHGWLFLETAGGVHSPGPSGTSQAELYAPLRSPVILVGDSRLGGISQTISSYESLKIRGYDVASVLLFQNDQYNNDGYLEEYLYKQGKIPVTTVPEPPARNSNHDEDNQALAAYYRNVDSSDKISKVVENLDQRAEDRVSQLQSMSERAHKTIWYPFTQQKLLSPNSISTIDSAHGDYFQVYKPQNDTESSDRPLLQPAFDGSASWWTQGLGHGSSQLTMAAAYAAGRYGHVMFAEAIHEPALTLAEKILQGTQNPRLTRTFYTDNGSTGCEVAIKMALRASRDRYGWDVNDKIEILGLKGSYHGDTIGAMDASEPCTFNEKVDWYQGKGYWFDYPTVNCTNGKWVVHVPEPLREHLGNGEDFESLSHVFDISSRSQSAVLDKYETYVQLVLEKLGKQGRKFGGLMMEPVILGAGGMIFVDPLFQRALVNAVRKSAHLIGNAQVQPTNDNDWSGLPVIHDEVFTGLYRLGRFTSSSFLGVHPDIAVNAKLLTGGLLPLCVTLASESIFNTFESDDKSDALLHGHSYTAHAIGCQVALESLDELQAMDTQGDWNWARNSNWKETAASHDSATTPEVWSVWSREFVTEVSQKTDQVSGIWALGSVLAISMRDADGAGYKSKAAAKLQATLKQAEPWSMHTRVLGNVFYIMASQKTSQEAVEEMQERLLHGLEQTS
ncbi:unnamed protein product [Clonostachys rosea]|uniref:Dethiobiotin synthase n=1 Tax=Bionectria ochroleuca TaxID=29856 RepID=A0ABY6U319_BIOOC|nr:unnamed protein product [Clonostachys rosea]